MWQRNDRRMMLKFLTGEVAYIILYSSGLDPLQHRVLIDNPLAREIKQDRALLHVLHSLLINEVASRFQSWYVQRDEITVMQQLVDTLRFFYLCRKMPSRIHGDFRIVPHYSHTQPDG